MAQPCGRLLSKYLNTIHLTEIGRHGIRKDSMRSNPEREWRAYRTTFRHAVPDERKELFPLRIFTRGLTKFEQRSQPVTNRDAPSRKYRKDAALDSFELNKIAGAVLASLLLAVSLNIISVEIFSSPKPARPGYVIPVAPETSPVEGKASPAPTAPPIAERLSTADAKKGEADARACQACHNFEKGAGAKMGPPLYGVVGRPKASVEGFPYSDGLKSKGGTWTYADIDTFLANPKAFAQGTKMTFAGESDPAKRADIIAYLRSLSDHPEPLPGK
jgi:cytochrome c